MKKSTFALTFSLSLIALITSCTKSTVKPQDPATTNTTTTTTDSTTTSGTTTTTDPTVVSKSSPTMNYQLKGINSTAGIALKTTAGGTIVWTAAMVNPTLIKFEAKKDGSEIEYKTTNSGTIDLMSATPSYFGNFTLSAGTYSELELKIQLNKGSNPSLKLNGNFSKTGTTIPVLVEINEFVELKTEVSNITLTDNTSFTSSTTFDLSHLTTGITEVMMTSAPLTGGVLIISSNSNVSLYNIILKNFTSEKHHHEIGHH